MYLRPLSQTLVLALCCAPFAISQEAPSSSSSKNAKPEQHVKREASAPEGVYRNAEFGFTYRTIVGWVDRTKDMQEGAGSGSVLLAVFERPPDAIGDTVNSAVVIAQESAASYPGLKTAADYVDPLTELVTNKGFKASGDAYEMEVGTKTLVRCDFTRDSKPPMWQSTLVFLQKNSIVSFTFLGGSADEVDALIEHLSFAVKRTSTTK